MNIGVASRDANSRARMRTTPLCPLPSLTRYGAYATRAMVSVRLVDSVVSLGERELTLLRPRDSVELLDEDAFARDEFMPYWAELWPSGLGLARLVLARDLVGSRVVELG